MPEIEAQQLTRSNDGDHVTIGTTTDAAWVSGSGSVVALLKKIAATGGGGGGGGAVTAADGALATIGTTTDAAYVTGAGTLVSLLKTVNTNTAASSTTAIARESGGNLAATAASTATTATNTATANTTLTTVATNTTGLAKEVGGNLAALVTVLGTVGDTAWVGTGNASIDSLLRAVYALLTTGNTNTTGLAKESGGNVAATATSVAAIATSGATSATNSATIATNTGATTTALTGVTTNTGNTATNTGTIATSTTTIATNTGTTATQSTTTATQTTAAAAALGTTADTAWSGTGTATLDAISKAIALAIINGTGKLFAQGSPDSGSTAKIVKSTNDGTLVVNDTLQPGNNMIGGAYDYLQAVDYGIATGIRRQLRATQAVTTATTPTTSSYTDDQAIVWTAVPANKTWKILSAHITTDNVAAGVLAQIADSSSASNIRDAFWATQASPAKTYPISLPIPQTGVPAVKFGNSVGNGNVYISLEVLEV